MLINIQWHEATKYCYVYIRNGMRKRKRTYTHTLFIDIHSLIKALALTPVLIYSMETIEQQTHKR